MKRAVLYARVSTDAQQKEGTIDSQVLELKRQIAAAGDVLVKEYTDDGYSGSLLDRPALEELRRDVKTNLFDAVYFLDTDRIARDVAYQTIILGELLKYGKQIIIKGKDYVNNPENKFTVTVLGAVAELERAKIIEHTTRGRLHRLRMGEMSSNGHRIYGYDYVRKTTAAPAALVINEEQAPVVRSIFEMFASGRFGLVTISRSLEERRLPTRLGRPLWQRDQIKAMLRNETYAGTRYFNRITRATETQRGESGDPRQVGVPGPRGMDPGQGAPDCLAGALRYRARETARARGALLPARHSLPPAGPRPMRGVRQPLFLLPTLPEGRAPVGEAYRLSSGRVPLQSARPREHARSDADRALPQFGDRHPHPRGQSIRARP
jgi:DNA invertase Pin-like site-specific DNA recombinase